MTEDELTDDQRPKRGFHWYEDRTSLHADLSILWPELSSANEFARQLSDSPTFDESYKIRAHRIDMGELRELAEMARELNERLTVLVETAHATWEKDE